MRGEATGDDIRNTARANESFVVLVTFALCLQWAFGAANFSHLQLPVFAIIVGAIIGIVLTLRRQPSAQYIALAVAIAVGIGDRLRRKPFPGSDVIDATREALNVVFAGQNPYFHVFTQSRPAGSPFPYMPGELLFYGIPYKLFHSIAHVDQAAGIGVILLIASLAPIIGAVPIALSVTVYSTFTLMANLSVDGSNENGLAFLLTAAFVLFVWSEHAAQRRWPAAIRRATFYSSAIFLTTAVLFKALAWFFVPFFALYIFRREARAGVRYFGAAACSGVALLLPFVIPSPTGLIANVYAGFVFHHTTWGLNFWNMLASTGPGAKLDGQLAHFAPLVSAVTVLGIFAWLIRRPIRSLSTAIFCGLAVLTPALLFARWSTAPYFTFATTLLAVAIPLFSAERVREQSRS